jgi:ketosteroid isomerase-like protein
MEGLARRSIDAYSRGDVEALLEQLDEEIEVYTPPELPNAGRYRGHQGFLQWLGQWDEACYYPDRETAVAAAERIN